MRPAELHSPSAEENYMTEKVWSLRSIKVATPLAPLKRLSPVDLPSANGFDKPFAASKFEKLNTEKLTVDWSQSAKS